MQLFPHGAIIGIIVLVLGIGLTPVFANEQVVIPLGASNPKTPFSLSPSVLNIKTGETVVWQNNDVSSHTITTGNPSLGADGRIESSVIQSGNTFSYTFDKSGVYQYFCLFHPWMTGVVNVGNGVSFEPSIMVSVSTDKQFYNSGDKILVSGQISKFIKDQPITVWITDSQGNGIALDRMEAENGNSFSANFTVGDNLWIPGNTYRVYAQYGPGSNIAYANVTFEPQSTGSTRQSANQQESNTSVQDNSQNNIPSYDRVAADSNNPLVAQTDHHLYEPRDQISVKGDVWGGILMQIGPAYLVTISTQDNNGPSVSTIIKTQLIDSNQNIVATKESALDSNNNYQSSFVLPDNSPGGKYTVVSSIEVKAGLLGALDGSIGSKLTTKTQILVEPPQDYSVKILVGYPSVKIASNSTVSGFDFEPDKKTIVFTVAGETGTKGVTEITIPKSILSGQMTVLIDGSIQSSGNMLVTSDTNDSTTLELNYHHSTHTIQIVGAQSSVISSVPEFPIAGPILAISIIMSVVFLRIMQFRK